MKAHHSVQKVKQLSLRPSDWYCDEFKSTQAQLLDLNLWVSPRSVLKRGIPLAVVTEDAGSGSPHCLSFGAASVAHPKSNIFYGPVSGEPSQIFEFFMRGNGSGLCGFEFKLPNCEKPAPYSQRGWLPTP